VSTTGSVNSVFIPAQGNDINSREGNTAVAKSFILKYVLATQQSLAAVPTGHNKAQVGRVLVVYDKQPNVTVASIAEILDVSSAVHPCNMLNLNNRARFLVLCDKTSVYEPSFFVTDVSGSGTNQIQFETVVKNLDLQVDWLATADTAPNRGAILLCFVGTLPAASAAPNDALNAIWTFRTRYGDS